jgi:hypothetical protein
MGGKRGICRWVRVRQPEASGVELDAEHARQRKLDGQTPSRADAVFVGLRFPQGEGASRLEVKA